MVVYIPHHKFDITDLEPVINSLSPLYQNIVVMGDFNHNLLSTSIYNTVSLFSNSIGLDIAHNNFKATHLTNLMDR